MHIVSYVSFHVDVKQINEAHCNMPKYRGEGKEVVFSLESLAALGNLARL